MKGILKVYHPEETLKYYIRDSYCKALYRNNQNFLDLEITTDDDLDHVEDDSLQYNFPQIRIRISEFPISSPVLEKNQFIVEDTDEEAYTEVDLFDDEEANVYKNELTFDKNEEGVLELIWKGEIDDFYTNSEDPIPFKLKCNFKEEEINIED